MPSLNCTINGNSHPYDIPIIRRIWEDFAFYYNPSTQAVHLFTVNIEHINDLESFCKTLNVSHVKKGDTVIFLLQFEAWMFMIENLKNSIEKDFSNLIHDCEIVYSSEQLNYNDIKSTEKSINHVSLISQDNFFVRDLNFNPHIFHNYQLKDKLFLSYNRRHRTHRCQLVSKLVKNDLLNDSLVSFLVNIPQENSTAEGTLKNDGSLTEENLNDLLRYLPKNDLIIDPYEFNSWISQDQYKKTSKHHHRSMISVVTETFWNEAEISFTEKIYRPLFFGHPFIVLAPSGFLKYLKKYGFKTFGNIIDESYDDILNPQERLDAVISVMLNFKNLSEAERHTTWNGLNEVAIENYEIYHSKKFAKQAGIFQLLKTKGLR